MRINSVRIRPTDEILTLEQFSTKLSHFCGGSIFKIGFEKVFVWITCSEIALKHSSFVSLCWIFSLPQVILAARNSVTALISFGLRFNTCKVFGLVELAVDSLSQRQRLASGSNANPFICWQNYTIEFC